MNRPTFVILSSCLILLCAGCSGREEAPTEPAVTNDSATKIAGADTADVPATEQEPAPTRQPTPAAEPAPAAAATPVSDPTPALAPVAMPGESIEVAATKAGLTRIGDAKCKMCHKIQHASWAKSSHAGLDPILDCESCHGPGSEYKTISIMKNREQALAAGLVQPEASFCKKCHADDWSDDLLAAAHEHKPAS
jgi:hypothetical protein